MTDEEIMALHKRNILLLQAVENIATILFHLQSDIAKTKLDDEELNNDQHK